MKFNETRLPQMYSKALYDEKMYNLPPGHTDKMYDVLFTGTANILSQLKSKERPVAYVFNATNGNFLAAAVVQFFEGDKGNPGNWSLVWTFEEADVPEKAMKLSLANIDTHSFFRQVAGEKYSFQFRTTEACINCISYTLIQLKKWLDENAKENEVVSIELDGIFEARVGVEDGSKVFTLEPDGEVKNLIKDDAAIEK